jgi:hypothetical protein
MRRAWKHPSGASGRALGLPEIESHDQSRNDRPATAVPGVSKESLGNLARSRRLRDRSSNARPTRRGGQSLSAAAPAGAPTSITKGSISDVQFTFIYRLVPCEASKKFPGELNHEKTHSTWRDRWSRIFECDTFLTSNVAKKCRALSRQG